MPDRPMRYCLVTPEGDAVFATATLHEIRTLIGGDGAGETGMEFLNSLYPVAAYYYVPFDEDTRRMNKTANGMFWELSAPIRQEDGTLPEDFKPEDRTIKLSGPVAFIDRHTWGLTAERESVLREAYEIVVDRLRRRGWL